MKIELTVWQFVRLMVFLEQHPQTGAGDELAPLLEVWSDVWINVDKDLEELSENDFEAYADMMMDKTVTIDDVASAHALCTADTLVKIAGMMREVIESGNEEESRESLEFETSELLRTAGEIRNQLQ